MLPPVFFIMCLKITVSVVKLYYHCMMVESIQTSSIDSVLIQEITNQVISKVIPALETSGWDDMWMAIGIGVVSGIIATAIFFMFMRYFKPEIKIGEKITKEKVGLEDGGYAFKYRFKFINMTTADIQNVSINLFLMRDYYHGKGKNYTVQDLEIAKNHMIFLSGRAGKNEDHQNNCVNMGIREDLEAIWNEDNAWLQLQIDCTHAVSGRRYVYTKKFTDPKTCIVQGKYDTGEDFEILK